jgi:ribonuclease HI
LREILGDFSIGGSQGNPPHFGVGVMLYISEDHFFKVRYAPGRGSNMKTKFTIIRALPFMVKMLNLRKIQVMGDSKVVID